MHFDEFPDFLETNLQFQRDLYMFGDLTIHLNLLNLNDRSFMDALQTYAFHQYLSFPTHFHSYWLDLFITTTCINIKAIFPTDGLLCHHCIVIDLWLQVG